MDNLSRTLLRSLSQTLIDICLTAQEYLDLYHRYADDDQENDGDILKALNAEHNKNIKAIREKTVQKAKAS